MVTRLTHQKGCDLIAARRPTADGARRRVGHARQRRRAGRGHVAPARRRAIPDRVAVRIGFDERLAHLIEGGADMFLMPSRFEPCGLNQMYSLRYGTVPVVRGDRRPGRHGRGRWTSRPRRGPGSSSGTTRRARCLGALSGPWRAFATPTRWQAIQRDGMRQDFSWDVSAREYVKVYRGTIQ